MMECWRMPTLTYSLPVISKRLASLRFPSITTNVVVCAAKGPRPRYPRVWKTNRRIGTISKSVKLVECIKELSNVKEEIYGALDSFIAWELEFPLITVKKALKTLEIQKEWKRIIQVAKWMLSKGQGRTMGTYFTLLNALAEDGRLDEAEKLWTNLFSQHLESMPRMFFNKMITIYYNGRMYEKLFEVFADMEELGIRPDMATVTMTGNVFQELGMLDKYTKLKKKYPPPKWEYRYVKGKRIRIRSTRLNNSNDYKQHVGKHEETDPNSIELLEGRERNSDEETGPNSIELIEGEEETDSDEPEELIPMEDQMNEEMHIKLLNDDLISQTRYSS